jgi:hypothetical protein
MTIFVINIGNLDYGQYTLPLIKKLCDYNNINLFVLENDIEQNIYNLHPSWLKLFAHDLIDDDFIISWDLDLLPLKMYDIKSIFNKEKLNLTIDTGILHGLSYFNNNFKYNCGFIGIPKSQSNTMKDIYYKYGKSASYPSYEQYYVNDYIAENNIDINIIDNKYNFLYNNSVKIDEIYNHHFTFEANHDTKFGLIKQAYDEYIRNKK